MTKVALLGAGFVAATHAAAYDRLPGAKLIAVLDTSAERARKLASERGARAYTDAEALFAGEEVDMGTSACPPSSTSSTR